MPHQRQAASPQGDALDDMLNNLDRDIEDALNGMDVDVDDEPTPTADRPRGATTGRAGRDLGIDDEVQVKVRKRVPKLDANLLSSANGIPRLQRIAKSELKFRGKGHEFSDVAELLHTYQAWLHRLYPRVKFVDGLAMVEKLGHKKDVQRLRYAWIDEGKPKTDQGPDPDHENLSATASPGTETDPSARQFNLTPDVASPPKGEAGHDPDHPSLISHGGPGSEAPQGALEDEDDLDQLLAEEPQATADPRRNQSNSTSGGAAPEENDFDDEEEVMRGMEFDDF